VLAAIAQEADPANSRVLVSQLSDLAPAGVPAAVINEDHLERVAQGADRGRDGMDRSAELAGGVVDRDDNADEWSAFQCTAGRGAHPWAHATAFWSAPEPLESPE